MAKAHDHHLTDLPFSRWLLFTIVPGLLPFGFRWVIAFISDKEVTLAFSDLLGALFGLCIFGFNELVSSDGKKIERLWQSMHWVAYVIFLGWISFLYGIEGTATNSNKLTMIASVTACVLVFVNLLLVRTLNRIRQQP
jgi:hypothetical protein